MKVEEAAISNFQTTAVFDFQMETKTPIFTQWLKIIFIFNHVIKEWFTNFLTEHVHGIKEIRDKIRDKKRSFSALKTRVETYSA